MKLKNILLVGLIGILCVLSSNTANATKLPDNVIDYVLKQVPGAGIRFDGLVSFPDGTLYIPVLPANPPKNAQGLYKSSFPSKKQLSQKPDVILFDNNLALLKVIKNKNGKPTVTDPKNIPFEVKTGVLPQDMLVPPGLILPDELKIILGDLKIPLTSSSLNNFMTEKPRVVPTKAPLKITVNPALTNKSLLVAPLDSNIVDIIPSNSSEAKYSLTLESLPKFIEPVVDDKFLLIAECGKTYVTVADLKQAVLAKKIELSFQPTEIVMNHDKSKAYVSVFDDESIFVIDIKSMSVIEKIKIKGHPKNLTMDEKLQNLVYIDKKTGELYVLDINKENYENTLITGTSNVSKVIPDGDIIYLLSRTANELQIINTKLNDYIYTQPVGKKPVDMILNDRTMYILAADNTLTVFNLDDYNIIKTIVLDTKGFSKQLIPVPGSDLFLITNAADKKYFVFDMKKNEVIQSVPINTVAYLTKLLNKPFK